ncbi:RMD1 family protein [Romeria aff. gracilis LEGE 07310]|uniref:RMD1 family protein n=1 Tax=Vasconcelosia minhoensis LEGE 07310 TaxID=915328 RepID=A0A8J7AL49_9CYAN|nr:RMD1 family protein [Romeria gracilis]MBE9079753.1 RMD1 family protein [Romeria aff. gracilis LEGE 07310]
MATELFRDHDKVTVRALFLGQRINLAYLTDLDAIAAEPPVVKAGENGAAVLFDYGTVVLFGLSDPEEAELLEQLQTLVVNPYEQPESEQAALRPESTDSGKVENGVILLAQCDIPRIQLIADVLSKSVVLAQYEKEVAEVFAQIEPFALGVKRSNWRQRQGEELLRQIGNTLIVQNKIVGQAEIIDKPELLWDYPQLDRLFARVEDEYEIRERHLTLEKKLALVLRTVETALELRHQHTSIRLEWYIVILIVLELLLSLYELFTKG